MKRLKGEIERMKKVMKETKENESSASDKNDVIK